MPVCHFNKNHEIGPQDETAWRLVIGWERKSHIGNRRGGSDIALREPYDQETWACDACIRAKRLGVDPARQESLI